MPVLAAYVPAASDSVPPVLLVTSLVGALSAAIILLGALRVLLTKTIGRRYDRYGRLSRLGTGAQVPFFTAVLGEPPAIQRTVVKDDYMVPLERDDPGYDPDTWQQKPEQRCFTVSVYIDRDYYVQTISDEDQTVLAYSVTTRSRRFRPSFRPVPSSPGIRARLRLRRRAASHWPLPRIVLGRTPLCRSRCHGPRPLRSAAAAPAPRRPQLRLFGVRLLRLSG